jgi:hypothetical protein
MRTLLNYATLGAIAFLANVAWEYSHLPLYTSYEHLGHGTALVLWASAGDVMYTFLVVLFVAICKRNELWFQKANMPEYILLGILGLATALFVEYKALALHRWAYTTAMPTLFGVGLSPMLQLTLLIPLSVYAARQLTR